jgi:RNA polymerase sigma factor (sigma-70 family)
MSDLQGTSPAAIDFDAAYRRLAPRLERNVSRIVRGPRPLIEEACQTAWIRLLAADPPIGAEVALGWLTTTASREAIRAVRAQLQELPFDAGPGRVIEFPARSLGPDRLVELREQLAEVRRLPVRQQRTLWLQSAGYSYGEISAQTGDSHRTIERQIARARQTLRERAAG